MRNAVIGMARRAASPDSAASMTTATAPTVAPIAASAGAAPRSASAMTMNWVRPPKARMNTPRKVVAAAPRRQPVNRSGGLTGKKAVMPALSSATARNSCRASGISRAPINAPPAATSAKPAASASRAATITVARFAKRSARMATSQGVRSVASTTRAATSADIKASIAALSGRQADRAGRGVGLAGDGIAQDRQPAVEQRPALAAPQRGFDRLGNRGGGIEPVGLGDAADRVDLDRDGVARFQRGTRADREDPRRQFGLYLHHGRHVRVRLRHAPAPAFEGKLR